MIFLNRYIEKSIFFIQYRIVDIFFIILLIFNNLRRHRLHPNRKCSILKTIIDVGKYCNLDLFHPLHC